MKKLIYLTLLSLAAIPATAQLKVGGNPFVIADGAMLQVDATGNRAAIQLARVALTGAFDIKTVLTPLVGFTVYNTATAGTSPNNVTPGYYYHNGIQWVKIISTSNGNDKNIYDGNGTIVSNRTVDQN